MRKAISFPGQSGFAMKSFDENIVGVAASASNKESSPFDAAEIWMLQTSPQSSAFTFAEQLKFRYPSTET